MKKIKHLLFGSIMCLAFLAALATFSKAPVKVNALVSIPDGQTLDENVDTISVKDLTYNGVTGQTMIALGANSGKSYTFNYSGENVNKNIVLKFKYDVVDMSDTSDSNSLEIYFRAHSDVWGTANTKRHTILFRGDGIHFGIYENSAFGYNKQSRLSEGVHTIEFGRIAILDGSGNPTNNYYVYYILDGTKKYDSISPLDIDLLQNNVYIRYGKTNTKNRMYDADLSYETPQFISVGNLKSSGNLVGNSITTTGSSQKLEYDVNNQIAKKSVIFAAKMHYRDSNDKLQIFIYNDSEQSSNYAGYIWIQSDQVYFGLNNADGTFNKNSDAIKYTTLTDDTDYNIEYGRLAIMNGDSFQNKYHVYFKLNGVIIYAIDQNIESSVANGGRVKLSGPSGIVLEGSVGDETAKQISVNDLRQGENPIENILYITANTDLTFDNTDHKDNYSVVFKFKYKALVLTENAIHVSSQTNKWGSASSFILNRNGAQTFIGKTKVENGNYESWNGPFSYTFEVDETYEVEFGRVAVMCGTAFLGYYRIYLKVNNTLISEFIQQVPKSVVQGNYVFITGNGHNKLYDISTTACVEGHTLSHTNSVAATCTTAGSEEYWTCSVCNKYFSDANGENEVASLEDLSIAALNHDLVDDAAVAATCTTPGKTAGHHCSRCDYTDGGEPIEALGHDYQVIVDKAATVFETGISHEECTRCHDKIKEGTVIPALACDHDTTLTPAVAPTCTTAGSKAYYTCTICNKYFEDEDGQIEITDLDTYLPVPAKSHNYGDAVFTWTPTDNGYTVTATRTCANDANHVLEGNATVTCETVPATCTQNGSKTYTATITLGEQEYTDTKVDTLVSPGHDLTHTVAVPATCTVNGNVEYWSCSVCNKKFSDENCENEINDVVILASHNLTHHEALSPTLTANGNVEYWSCSVCEKNFSNAQATAELANVTLTLDTTIDSLSVSDLTFDGQTNQSVIADNKDTDVTFKFAQANTNKNLVFTFKYDLVDAEKLSNNDKACLRIHFDVADDKWDVKNSFMIRPDNLFLRDSNSSTWIKRAPLPVGLYLIEFGRIAILNGTEPTGKYYVYYKIDGTLYDSVVNTYDLSKMGETMFINIGSDNPYNKVYDANLTYEEAKVISVSDLRKGTDPACNTLKITGHTDLTYDNADHKANYSIVFKFKYEVVELKNNQFHLSCTGKDANDSEYKWGSASSFILVRGDGEKFYLGKATKDSFSPGWKEGSYTMAVGTTYNIEYGRLAVMNGTEFNGRYYFYLKINGVLVSCADSEMPEVVAQGNLVFITADGLNTIYDITYVPCSGTHTLTKIDGTSMTCTTDGTEDSWWCSNCGKLFSDANGTTEITAATVIPAAHNLTHYDANPGADCLTAGTIEYWECSVCNKMFSDENATNEITTTEGAYGQHALVKTDAVVPTCTTAGNIDYWICTVCNKKFSDATCTTEVTDVSIPAAHTLTKVDAKAPTCTTAGNIDYWTCSVCNKMFSDANGTTEVTDIVVPATHTLTKVDAVPATCTTDGTIEYWVCSVCNKKFSDANGTTEITDIVDPAGHKLTRHAATPATCTTDGNIEYYHCSECGKNFSDAAGTTQVLNVGVPAAHTLTKVDAKAPTCTEDGNIEYWVCSVCNKKFSDANGTTEVADVTIAATGHQYGDDGICTVCGATDPDYTAPKRGCKASISGGVIVLFAGITAAFALKRKKEQF